MPQFEKYCQVKNSLNNSFIVPANAFETMAVYIHIIKKLLTMRKTFFVPVIVMFFIVACNKQTIDELYEDKTGKGPGEVTPVVTASFWRLTDIRLTYSNGMTYDSTIDDCKKDDLATYQKNGDITIIHGSALCSGNPSPADGKFGTWQLLENATKLKETFIRDIRGIPAGTVREYHIDRVKFQEMVISRVVMASGGNYTETTTLTR